MTHFSHSALTLCVTASLLVACSESFITTPDDAAMTVPGADALGSAFRGEVEAAPSWSDYEIAIETGVDRDSILAGEVVKVFCDITGLPDTTDKPALSWFVSHSPAEAQNEPVIDGDDLILSSTGTYFVMCQMDATGFKDPTPASILVKPNEPVSVNTVVEPTTLTAGESATVGCSGVDAYDNAAEEDWDILIQPTGSAPGPPDGLTEANMQLLGLKEGTYGVSCVHGSGVADPLPVEVSVYHGLPHRLVATLANPTIQAGQATTVSCSAEDKEGNLIYDLPMSVHLDEALTLEGAIVSGTQSGIYEVMCVPVGLEWTAFVIEAAELQIIPGMPVAIELSAQPPKPFFSLGEVIGLLVLAFDSFDNPIVDAELLPIEVTPSGSHDFPSDTSIAFSDEGLYEVAVTLAENQTLTATIELGIEGSPPELTIESPLRGAALTGSKPSVTIYGTAYDEVAGITEVWVNEQQAVLHPDGSWTAIMVPRWGLNVIHVVAVDAAGATDELTQSFYFAEKYHQTDPMPVFIPNGLQQYLSETTIDDGQHVWGDPDDMATVLEQVVLMADKTSWTPPPKGVGLGYELKLTNLTPSPPHLKLDPREGGMDLEVDFSSFSANVSLENECKVLFIDLCPDVSGTMMIDGVEIEADLWASATNGELDVSLTGADVDVGWINVSIDGLSTVMNLLGLGTWTFIVDLVIDVIINLFSGTVEGAIAGGLGPALETAFTSLITNMQIHDNYATGSLLTGLPTATFAFDTMIDNMKFTPDGGRVEFATRILSSKKIYQSSPGSISRGTCLKGLMAGTTLPGDYEFESSYKDDVANAILTAAWRNGALNGNITMSAFPYALLSGGFEVDDQPVMGMELEMMYTLPPILNSCDPSGVTFIQVGDLYLQGEVTSAAFASGEGEFGVYVSFELLSATEVAEGFWGDTVGLGLGALYAIHYHWEMLPPEFEADPEPLEAFIEELFWKGINNQLTSPLGNFEIHGLGFADSVPGVEIAPTIQVLSRDGGAVVFQGELP